ncbi:MAG: ABC transporter ATP-binding protein [Bacillota bacterium]
MNAVELKGITKKFGDVIANDKIDFLVEKGEIHCLLGENGAGKSTLMKILFGLYSQDEGQIIINGQEINKITPSEAIKYGLGMIHQHFMLVDRLTVTENVIAGREIVRNGLVDLKTARSKIKELSEKYNLKVKPEAKIENISVGEQQRVEILKALYRQAEILILDEPTAVLTPQETEELFQIMEDLKNDGKTIIFITHKLKETMEISDRVTVLRDGKSVGTVKTSETSPEKLARLMVGRDVVLRVEKNQKEAGKDLLKIKNLSLSGSYGCGLKDLNFTVKEGEILGIAGVEGNGQHELEETLMGLLKSDDGEIYFKDQKITNFSTYQRRQKGIAHIPSDRLKRGLVSQFNLDWNFILGSEWQEPFANTGILNKKSIRNYGKKLIKEFDIRTPGLQIKAGQLSGGNQQKAIIARELSSSPDLILAAQPTRGVDVGAIEYIHNLLLEMRAKGKAILLISAELDELRSLSDRILVIYEGQFIAEKTDDFDEQELGLLMAGKKDGDVNDSA